MGSMPITQGCHNPNENTTLKFNLFYLPTCRLFMNRLRRWIIKWRLPNVSFSSQSTIASPVMQKGVFHINATSSIAVILQQRSVPCKFCTPSGGFTDNYVRAKTRHIAFSSIPLSSGVEALGFHPAWPIFHSVNVHRDVVHLPALRQYWYLIHPATATFTLRSM